jgi:hypothetical protein
MLNEFALAGTIVAGVAMVAVCGSSTTSAPGSGGYSSNGGY